MPTLEKSRSTVADVAGQPRYCRATGDLWSENGMGLFGSIYAHGMTDTWVMEKVLIGLVACESERHTHENIKKWTDEALEGMRAGALRDALAKRMCLGVTLTDQEVDRMDVVQLREALKVVAGDYFSHEDVLRMTEEDMRRELKKILGNDQAGTVVEVLPDGSFQVKLSDGTLVVATEDTLWKRGKSAEERAG